MNIIPDLHDTTNCPLGHRCESCGTAADPLAVKTLSTPVGVLCMTLCPRCAASSVPPPITVTTAARFVGQHCQHLGISTAEMEAGR